VSDTVGRASERQIFLVEKRWLVLVAHAALFIGLIIGITYARPSAEIFAPPVMQERIEDGIQKMAPTAGQGSSEKSAVEKQPDDGVEFGTLMVFRGRDVMEVEAFLRRHGYDATYIVKTTKIDMTFDVKYMFDYPIEDELTEEELDEYLWDPYRRKLVMTDYFDLSKERKTVEIQIESVSYWD